MTFVVEEPEQQSAGQDQQMPDQENAPVAGMQRKSAGRVNIKGGLKKLMARKWTFVKVWVLTFVLACAYILPQPRYYNSQLMLVPESSTQDAGGSLSSLASSFGFNLGGMEGGDAFFPEIYPDVIGSNEFLVGLFDAKIETEDGSLKTDYYTYLTQHQKKSPYQEGWDAVKGTVKGWFSKPAPHAERAEIDPNHLDVYHNGLVQMMNGNISCTVSKMTNVITISVQDQDPLVCTIIADTVRLKLQEFITDYRTKKARLDADYYQKLCDEAKAKYEKASQEYSDYCDRHTDIILQANISERDQLENELSNTLTAYNALTTQYQAAAAKIQERTPSFTLLQRASVPVKPAGPKRMIFVAVMLFLATFGTAAWIMRKELVRWF